VRPYLGTARAYRWVIAAMLLIIWGAGLAADDPLIEQPRHWPGLNLLGFALADVREGIG